MLGPVRPNRAIRLLATGAALLGAATLAVLAVAAPAQAAPAHAVRTQPAAADVATVRVAHLSPDMPGVDVYLTSFTGTTRVFLRDAKYGQVSPYQQIAAGNYTFAVRRHDASPDSTPLKSWTLAAQRGYAYTAAVVGSGAHRRGVVLDDNLTPPRAGHANVRLIQASSRSGTTNVVAKDGPVIAHDAAFGSSTGYASVRAGTWPLQATGDGRTADADVSVPAGSVTSLILLDAKSGGTRLTSVVDADGAAKHSAPTGSINAGGGGTARTVIDRPGAPDIALALGAAIVLLSVGLSTGLVAARRRAAGTPRR